MNFVHNILIVLFILLLIVGCRSSRSGTSHSDVQTNHLKETRKDSIDFNAKFARYLHEHLTSPSGSWSTSLRKLVIQLHMVRSNL